MSLEAVQKMFGSPDPAATHVKPDTKQEELKLMVDLTNSPEPAKNKNKESDPSKKQRGKISGRRDVQHDWSTIPPSVYRLSEDGSTEYAEMKTVNGCPFKLAVFKNGEEIDSLV